MKHKAWIFLSGLVWLIIGSILLYKGLRFLSLEPVQTARIWMFIALLIGFIKGRFVLSKTAQKLALKILSLPLPIRITQVYNIQYVALLAIMVLFGIIVRFLPNLARGTIDVAVGSALIHGAIAYFKAIYDIRFLSQSR